MKKVSPQTRDQSTVRSPLSYRISETAWKVYLRLRVNPSSQTFGIRGLSASSGGAISAHRARLRPWSGRCFVGKCRKEGSSLRSG